MRYLPLAKLLLITTLSVCCNHLYCFSEGFNEDYFKKNLQQASYPIDDEASAVILYEHTSVDISFENHHVKQTTTIRRIIRILKQDALDEANVSVYFPSDDINNYVYDVQGTTYNLAGQTLQATDLPRTDMYKRDNGKHEYEIKFVMPVVKEGSIIDYTYKVVAMTHDMLPVWHIQGKYPKLLSEYELYYPSAFEITTISHARGEPKLYRSIKDAVNGAEDFCRYNNTASNIDGNNTTFVVRKNIDAVKTDEPFINNVHKQMERMEFIITGQANGGITEHFMNTWNKVDEAFMKKDNIDNEINGENHILDHVVDSIIKMNPDTPAMAKAIYSYVRANYKNDPSAAAEVNNITDIYKHKISNVVNINLLLTAMLVHAGITAAPILIGTTNEIPFNSYFPVMNRIDYLACVVTFSDSSRLYLDASDKNNCYSMLPPYCYNGFAWILGGGHGVELTNDMLEDKSVTGVKISGFTDTTAQLEITQKLGLQRSENLRKQQAKDDKPLKSQFENEAHKFPSNITISATTIENVENPDTNLVVKYTGTIHIEKNTGTLFLNASLVQFMHENPFKAATRKLPVEFPYRSDNKYFMTIMLPGNYEPDSLPGPIRLDYDKESMVYKRMYSYSPQVHILTMSADYAVNVTDYPSEDYASIRELFGKIIPLNNEIITLKKTTAK